MSTLVTYFSQTGRTAALAHQIAMRLGATEEPILELHDRSGAMGSVSGALGAAVRAGSDIGTPHHEPAGFDMVVIGTPVWAAGAAPAVNRYIDTHRESIDRVAFFCTEGAVGDGLAFRQMERRLGKAPLARLAVTDAELQEGAIDAELARFVGEIGAARA